MIAPQTFTSAGLELLRLSSNPLRNIKGRATTDQSPQPLCITTFHPEILSQIALYLDKTSAIQFGLTCRTFYEPAQPSIWRSVDIQLNPNYGIYPTVVPYAPEDEKWREWEAEEYWRGEKRHRTALLEIHEELGYQLDGRRLGMIKGVTVEPRAGTAIDALYLLDLVSPKILFLDICGSPCQHGFLQYDSFELHLLKTKISFPTLTHVHLHAWSIQIVGAIPLLTNATPNLILLQLETDHSLVQPDWESFTTPDYPSSFKKLPKLQRLRVVYDDDYNDGFGFGKLLAGLIEAAPMLQVASIMDFGQVTDDVYLPLMTSLMSRPLLRDLIWSVSPVVFEIFHFMDGGGCEYPGFPALRRLVMASSRFESPMISGFIHLFEYAPVLPKLEVMIIDHPSHDENIPAFTSSDFHFPLNTSSMTQYFSHALVWNTELRLINLTNNFVKRGDLSLFGDLDRMESLGSVAGNIVGFRCDAEQEEFSEFNEELILARIYDDHVVIADIPVSSELYSVSDGYIHLDYKHWQRKEARRRVYRREDQKRWQLLAYYRRFQVPMFIINRVEAVENLFSFDYMTGRGNQLRVDSWRELREWHESMW